MQRGFRRASGACATTQSARSTIAAACAHRLASSNAGDEIGDLSRSFGSVLARLSDYASYQEKMASRLSHELRTPIAVVRSSLDNLGQTPLARHSARVHGACAGRTGPADDHPDADDRGDATGAEPVRCRARALRSRGRGRRLRRRLPAGVSRGAHRIRRARKSGLRFVGAPDLIAQMLDKLVANAIEFATGRRNRRRHSAHR